MNRPGDGMKVLVVGDSSTPGGETVSASALSTELEAQIVETGGPEVDIEGFDGDLEDVTSSLADIDVVVTLGEPALLGCVRARVDVPILPVGIDGGIESISRTELEAALRGMAAGEYSTTEVPTIHVDSDGDQYRALMDVMAVTAEAAKISEYRVIARDGADDTVIDTVRADGIVASAPAGTPGYGTAAGGPILDPVLEAVSVIPVGPFRVEQPHWVLELPVSIEVARGEVPVSLLVDDQEVGHITDGTEVALAWDDPIEVVQTPVSVSPLAESETPDGVE